MRKAIFAFILAALSVSVFSQSSGTGVGVILGEPTGLTAKMWTSRTTAIDAAAAWSLQGNGYIHFHVDALVHSFTMIDVDSGKLPLYMGLGARVLLAEDPAIGVRVPFGIAYHLHSAPFEIFFEVAPILDLLPGTGFDMNSALGLRYYL